MPQGTPPAPHPAAAPVLVTGASGCIGGALAHRLRADGVPVRALVRPTSDTGHLRAAGVELVTGDIRDRGAVERAAEGVGLIYHVAGVFRTAGHPDQCYFDVNAGGTENVLHAARRHGVPGWCTARPSASTATCSRSRAPRTRRSTRATSISARSSRASGWSRRRCGPGCPASCTARRASTGRAICAT